MINIEAERNAFESVLAKHFAKHENTTLKPFTQLANAAGYSLHAGGKRIRALLALAGCRASVGEEKVAIVLGCALEYLHCYSLIHDDLPALDDDDLRRGIPTNHMKFGEAQAILSGNALHSLCFVTLGEINCKNAVEIQREVARAALLMLGGQWLDITATINDTDIQTLEHIHQNKTGAIIEASLVAGGLCCDNVQPKQLSALRSIGKNLGLAFQITDDLLEYIGTELGKSKDSDARNAKPTYPLLLGIEQSKNLVAKCNNNIKNLLNAFEPANAKTLIAICDFLSQRNKSAMLKLNEKKDPPAPVNSNSD